MTLFQWFALFIILLVLIKILTKYRHKELPLQWLLFWLLLWGAAIVLIVLPETSSFLARYFGIGRGVDLIIYGALGLIFYILFRLVIRIEKMERNITEIVRYIALTNEDKKE
ncbi:MAG: DUF2304 domain-containing protein [Parcubacteria group bacterium]|nr:DUF2304 domain-containing protein [Parcubacteria group bacterium]